MTSAWVWALRGAFAIVWFVVLALVLALEIGYGDSNPWQRWRYDPGPFCERERSDRFLREPTNALSDFSFLALGLYLLAAGVEDQWRLAATGLSGVAGSPLTNNVLERFPSLTLAYGLANIIHAIGTFSNHACRCHAGHRLDLTGMWLASGWASLVSALRMMGQWWPDLFKLSDTRTDTFPAIFLALYLLMFVFHWLASDVWYSDGSYDGIEPLLVIANIAVVVVCEAVYILRAYQYNATNLQLSDSRKYRLAFPSLVLGVVSIGAGAALGHVDAKWPSMCIPDATLQLHAVWHCLAALCLLSMYRYYRTERGPLMQLKHKAK